MPKTTRMNNVVAELGLKCLTVNGTPYPLPGLVNAGFDPNRPRVFLLEIEGRLTDDVVSDLEQRLPEGSNPVIRNSRRDHTTIYFNLAERTGYAVTHPIPERRVRVL